MEQKGYCGQGARSDRLKDLEALALSEDMENWGNALPDTLQRGGPEIYRNLIGGTGRRSLRDIINDHFPPAARLGSSEYLELLNLATSIDFLVHKHKHSAAHLMQALATDDAVEIGLRRISAWLHEKGTGDKAAAQSMLAVQPRGQYANAATGWLLEQSQFPSQADPKTQDRGTAARGPGDEGRKSEGCFKGATKGRKVQR